jgi:hypothetical protein
LGTRPACEESLLHFGPFTKESGFMSDASRWVPCGLMVMALLDQLKAMVMALLDQLKAMVGRHAL